MFFVWQRAREEGEDREDRVGYLSACFTNEVNAGDYKGPSIVSHVCPSLSLSLSLIFRPGSTRPPRSPLRTRPALGRISDTELYTYKPLTRRRTRRWERSETRRRSFYAWEGLHFLHQIFTHFYWVLNPFRTAFRGAYYPRSFVSISTKDRKTRCGRLVSPVKEVMLLLLVAVALLHRVNTKGIGKHITHNNTCPMRLFNFIVYN